MGRLVLPDDADDDEAAVIMAAVTRYLAELEADSDSLESIDRWQLKARLGSITRRRVELPPVAHPDPWIMADRLDR